MFDDEKDNHQRQLGQVYRSLGTVKKIAAGSITSKSFSVNNRTISFYQATVVFFLKVVHSRSSVW
jgi:hypothetical protein